MWDDKKFKKNIIKKVLSLPKKKTSELMIIVSLVKFVFLGFFWLFVSSVKW